MTTITLFTVVLILATLLCALVAGFLFAFAVVVMPGIKRLSDAEFVRAFQGIDGMIQANQPLFVLVWLGSVLALIGATVIGFGQLDTLGKGLILVSLGLYLLGVQLPTAVINVPLNNQLQTLDTTCMDSAEIAAARQQFEPRWNQWNRIRTTVATLVALLLIILTTLI